MTIWGMEPQASLVQCPYQMGKELVVPFYPYETVTLSHNVLV
jgi:hypothetical protein